MNHKAHNKKVPIKQMIKAPFLISTGGMIYYNVELLIRGFSHISMFFCGGLSFYTIGLLNENPRHSLSLINQMFLGSFIVTVYELITGLIVNRQLHLHVWDYSEQPFNYKGQICLYFSILWFFLTPLCILLDDLLRYLLFNRKLPDYIKKWKSLRLR